jgi:hypothetical protein
MEINKEDIDYKKLSREELLMVIEQYEKYIVTLTRNEKLKINNILFDIISMVQKSSNTFYRIINMISDFSEDIKKLNKYEKIELSRQFYDLLHDRDELYDEKIRKIINETFNNNNKSSRELNQEMLDFIKKQENQL